MSTSFVDRIRPLVADLTLGERLFVVALLESGSAERYRAWATEALDPELARGLRGCAEREDEIAKVVRAHFSESLRPPANFDSLAKTIQAEVETVFGAKMRHEQYRLQAEAERGGEQLWKDLAAAEENEETNRVLLKCAELEAASAEYLETITS
jgi:hypothetical protein